MVHIATNKKTGEKSRWGYIYLRSTDNSVIRDLVGKRIKIPVNNSHESYTFEYIKTTIELEEQKSRKRYTYGK